MSVRKDVGRVVKSVDSVCVRHHCRNERHQTREERKPRCKILELELADKHVHGIIRHRIVPPVKSRTPVAVLTKTVMSWCTVRIEGVVNKALQHG